jgi:hypothetical protein
LSNTDPPAQALLQASHAGEVDSLKGLLREHPGLASARLTDENGGSSTPLHAATYWPGYFALWPRDCGRADRRRADPDAAVEGSWQAETPRHWAASSGDGEVAEP